LSAVVIKRHHDLIGPTPTTGSRASALATDLQTIMLFASCVLISAVGH